MNLKSSLIVSSLFLFLGIKLFSQDYNKLNVNETIKVNYEPYVWRIGSPETYNIDKVKLDAFFERISEWENLQSILVIKDDKLILEKYYKNTDKYSAFNTYSITKSFTSALIGIAIKQKLIASETDKMITYFPDYLDRINDPRKGDLTLKHLLTMTGGLKPEEWWNPSIDYALLEAPIDTTPGSKFLYYNALPHLLSAIISKSTNLSIKEYAEQYLFKPLEIKCAYWKKDGEYYSGRSNTYFTPRDLARLGSLYLNKGKINGEQIIDSLWVEKSFINYSDSDENFFLTDQSLKQTGYGYLWWIFDANNIVYYSAYGAGDQFLLINPLDNTIVVISQIYKETWFEKKEDIDKVSELLSIINNKNEE